MSGLESRRLVGIPVRVEVRPTACLGRLAVQPVDLGQPPPDREVRRVRAHQAAQALTSDGYPAGAKVRVDPEEGALNCHRIMVTNEEHLVKGLTSPLGQPTGARCPSGTAPPLWRLCRFLSGVAIRGPRGHPAGFGSGAPSVGRSGGVCRVAGVEGVGEGMVSPCPNAATVVVFTPVPALSGCPSGRSGAGSPLVGPGRRPWSPRGRVPRCRTGTRLLRSSSGRSLRNR